MAITRWSPLDELTNLRTTMDRLFGDALESGQDGSGSSNLTFRLPVDIQENDNAYLIQAPVAGFKPEDVEVTVSGNVLTIKASRKEQKEDNKGNYLRREIVVGDLMRQIALPNDARADNISAAFNNGVLRLEVPREPKPQPKKIEIRSAAEKSDSNKQMAGTSSR